MKIGVIGAGSYGTCLAKHLGDMGMEVRFWCRSPDLAASLRETRENKTYLPGHLLGDTVQVTSVLEEAVRGSEVVVGVTPSHAIREIFSAVAPHLAPETVVVNASKGLEEGTFKRIDEVYADVLPEPNARRAAYLSGPTFAVEVAAHLPSAIVVAGRDHDVTESVQRLFANEYLRVYSSNDVIGVLMGGALKNIVAISAGLSDGLGFGHNARAALITRGLAEMSRLGAALGADRHTFAGLSGLGDLVLTCAGDLSRNRRVGLALAQGKSREQITSEMKMVAEGVKTARVAHLLAARIGVEVPQTTFIYEVLYEDRDARVGIPELMTRTLKRERD